VSMTVSSARPDESNSPLYDAGDRAGVTVSAKTSQHA
jgi:hypothetical protein